VPWCHRGDLNCRTACTSCRFAELHELAGYASWAGMQQSRETIRLNPCSIIINQETRTPKDTVSDSGETHHARRAAIGKTLREGAVIIASVLIALAVDAWWGEREDRVREQAYLSTLVAELDSLRVALDTAISRDSLYLSDTKAVLEVLRDSQPPTPRTDSIASIFALNYSTFDPPTGTLRLLVTSDQSALILSEETRAALQAAEAKLTLAEGLLARTETEAWSLAQRYVGLVETLWDAHGRRPAGGPLVLESYPARILLPLAVQRGSPELRGIYQYQVIVLLNRLGYLRSLGPSIDRLRESVR